MSIPFENLKLRVESDGMGPVVRDVTDGSLYACVTVNRHTDNGHAFATLLAAAPEMARALRWMVDLAPSLVIRADLPAAEWNAADRSLQQAVAQARAALATIRGQA